MGIKVRGVKQSKAGLNRIINDVKGAKGCPGASVSNDNRQLTGRALYADRHLNAVIANIGS
jgi:hypothetical protein